MRSMYVSDHGEKPVRFTRTRPELEQRLTDLLSANPNLLADSLSDSVEDPERWFEVKDQFPLVDGRGQTIFADHLYLDQAGTPILVEDKLSGNPESKRLVVAQMIDYAAALEATKIEDLKAYIDGARQAEFEPFLPAAPRSTSSVRFRRSFFPASVDLCSLPTKYRSLCDA